MPPPTRHHKTLLLLALAFSALIPTATAQRAFIQRFDAISTNTEYFGFFKVAAAPDGGWAVANCDAASQEIVVLRFDSCGDLAWSHSIACAAPYRPRRCADVFFDPSSGDLVVGAGVSYNGFGYFHVIRLTPAGQLRWARTWKADHLGPGVFCMGRLAGGAYFFAGTSHPPAGPHDFVGIIDTAGQLLSVRTYYRASAGYQTVATALRDGDLLVRRGPELYRIDPLTGAVGWSRALLAPMYNHSKPLELEDGLLVVGQFANSLDLHSALPLFFTPSGQFEHAGELFRANGGGLSNLANLQIRRVEPLPDGNFVTVTTDSLPVGLLSVVVFAPSGQLVRQTFVPSGLPGVPLLNHDFCLLPGGDLAIAANAGGRLTVLRTGAGTVCNARAERHPVPYQTTFSGDSLAITVASFPFEPIDVAFSIAELEPGATFLCDTTALLPDRDTTLPVCPGDTVWADAFYPGADRYVWADGVDSVRVRLYPGQERVATVWVDCQSFVHRFVGVLPPNCPCPLEFPTAFTPNGDGRNDVFRPVRPCAFESYELAIYNRWGERVFRTLEPDAAWGADGLPADVYVYRLTYRVFGGPAGSRVGEVTVVR